MIANKNISTKYRNILTMNSFDSCRSSFVSCMSSSPLATWLLSHQSGSLQAQVKTFNCLLIIFRKHRQQRRNKTRTSVYHWAGTVWKAGNYMYCPVLTASMVSHHQAVHQDRSLVVHCLEVNCISANNHRAVSWCMVSFHIFVLQFSHILIFFFF